MWHSSISQAIPPLTQAPANRCGDCLVRHRCLPPSLPTDELHQFAALLTHRRPLQRGDHLYRAGDPPHSLFAIRSGALKTYLIDDDGHDQITGFHLPGELIGLDAIGLDRHPSFAAALETTSLCQLSLVQLETLHEPLPNLRSELLRIISRSLHAEHRLLHLNHRSAEDRLAGFLLDLSERFARRGLSRHCFVLPMSRCDIANYLGLTSETVSRLLARYRQRGWLHIEGREVRLNTDFDLPVLTEHCPLP